MLDDSLIALPELAAIRCRFWDDEGVVYNQLTGETHLVDGMGAEIFKLLSTKKATQAQLLKTLHSVFEFDSGFDTEKLLANLILEYQKLGLVIVTENNPA